MSANIQGLNIVQPQQASSDSQDLLSAQAFPDISAQLDLWTNLTFDTDEGSIPRTDEEPKNTEEEEEDAKSPSTANGEKAVHDGHVNVVTATNLGTNVHSISQSNAQSSSSPHLSSFDLNALLSGFGVDPYASLSQQANPGAMAPSLAQLLALHSHAQQLHTPMPNPFSHFPVTPSAPSYPRLPHIVTPQAPPQAPAPSPAPAPALTTTAAEPPTKRVRARKSSVSSPEALSPDAQTMALAAAEDKRRRNTAASARFRLKKKEREAALEGKAKELEARVNELERECEGLRRENGWLKGLVVGVTGAAQGPVPPPSLSPTQLASLTNPTTAVKRNREELEI
ncbi:Regulatory protein cys-3 [Leucoagaricus sp. SymC.cos]|nr:Regulatory protein cys-3 [Leucoagaricus sp. SymC.cos]